MQANQLLQASFEQDMRSSGLRITHVRQRLFEVLAKTNKPLSVKELVEKTDEAHFVSIYRSIDALHKAGIIKQVPRGFKNLYELSDTYRPHHHHATCEICGKSTSTHDQKLEKLMSDLSVKAGFEPTKHTFEIFGVCNLCRISRVAIPNQNPRNQQ
ncbi:transcriptional repressor [Candidatus Nomurabacteria bacterium]|nr:transcriptional repressor [Candidatus Nomurabacteria bacterium]